MCFHLSNRRKSLFICHFSSCFRAQVVPRCSFTPFRPSISTLCLPIQCSLLRFQGQGQHPACSRDMYLESGPHQCQGTCLYFDEAPCSGARTSPEDLHLGPAAHQPLPAPLEPVSRWGQCYEVPSSDPRLPDNCLWVS